MARKAYWKEPLRMSETLSFPSFIPYTSAFCKLRFGHHRGTQAGQRQRVVDEESHDEGPEHSRAVGFHQRVRRSRDLIENADEKSDGPGDVPGPVDAQPRSRPLVSSQDVIGGHGAADRAEGRADDLEENDQVLGHSCNGEEGADGHTDQRGDSL